MPATTRFSLKNRKTILIVEDDEGIGNLLEETFLEETTYSIMRVDGSLEALDVIKERKPDLFIVDYRLPDMTGIELHDEIIKIKGLEMSPFILVSANLPVDEVKKRQIIGMKKPFDLNKLVDIVNRLLV